MRNAKIEQFLCSVDTKATDILQSLPTCLKDGYRTLFILERAKDGGHNKEEKQVFNFAVTTNEAELSVKLKEFLWLKYFYDDKELRIYFSVNERNPHKAVRNVMKAILDSYYADQLNRDLVVKKIVKGTRSYIMNPNTQKSSYFLLDVDDEEGKDIMGETLQEMGELEVEELYRRRTKNGWHIVTKPFNPNLWRAKAEIKKDGLLLLDF